MLGFYLMATRRVQQTLGRDWFHSVAPSRECAHYDCQACRRYFAELGRAEESLGRRRSSGPVNTTPPADAAYVCSDFHPDRELPDYCEGCTRHKDLHT